MRKEEIKHYWDERARQHADSAGATTDDVYLRELEIATIIQTLNELALPEAPCLLDVGCGDGYSTLGVARAAGHFICLGLDYSENMVAIACQRLSAEAELRQRVAFAVGDVAELRTACGEQRYDVVVTDRCLINLDSFDSQRHALAQIAQQLKPGGYYVAIENFIEGHENMNAARRQLGVPEIPVREHNLFFRESQFVEAVEPFFSDLRFKDFSSSYYFATRVIYSAMCKLRGEMPDYHHDLHRLAPALPWVGQFSPIRMAIMRRKAV